MLRLIEHKEIFARNQPLSARKLPKEVMSGNTKFRSMFFDKILDGKSILKLCPKILNKWVLKNRAKSR